LKDLITQEEGPPGRGCEKKGQHTRKLQKKGEIVAFNKKGPLLGGTQRPSCKGARETDGDKEGQKKGKRKVLHVRVKRRMPPKKERGIKNTASKWSPEN